jgi:hypothetical protein
MKKIICTLLAFFIFSCLITNANAVIVRGSLSCGKWVSDKSENKADGWSLLVNHSWLMGFLSGLAVYSKKDILKDIDPESLYLWVDNYCLAHPLEYSDDAGGQLFNELKKQKGLK